MAVVEECVHKPVLLKEVIEFLKPRAGGIYVDATLGGAGHAAGLLRECGEAGLLLGIDQDGEILEIARQKLESFGGKVRIRKGNFSRIGEILKEEKISGADGILLDLGVSSLQLDEAGRGFSFQKEGPIDMRMDPSSGERALDKIAESDQEELSRVLAQFGEERFAKKIAAGLLDKMKRGELKTTRDVAQTAFEAYPPKWRHGRSHPATRTFLGLRIWVNDELGCLKECLREAPGLLNAEGRFCVISYHSLEDRLVKHHFRNLAKEESRFRVLTKKPLRPGEGEIVQNPRARSAKLRVLERYEKGI